MAVSLARVALIAIVVVVALMGTSGAAQADDTVISTAKLKLKRSASGKERLVFVSKDAGVPSLTYAHSPPSPLNMRVTLFALGVPEANTNFLRDWVEPFDGPPDFEVKGSNGKYVYKFKHKTAADGVSAFKLILWRPNRGLKIIARDAMLPLLSTTGGVALRMFWLESGVEHRVCTAVTGESIKVDKVGRFSGSNAPIPAFVDCDDESITGPVATDVCGDGLITGTEACDGERSCDRSDVPVFGTPFAECVIPAVIDECTCCAMAGSLIEPLPCCQPSLVLAYPDAGGGSYQCIPSSCAPPFECASGDTCLEDESCCGGDDAPCGGYLGGIFRTCCGNLVCTPLNIILDTCQPPGPCTVNADCATDFCDSGLCAD